MICVLEDLFGGSPLVESEPPWDSAGHHIQPGPLWGGNVRPFPTNVWWQNMVNDPGELVSAVNPYLVKTMVDGLHVCLPTREVQPTYIYEAFLDNVIMSATVQLGSHQVIHYDDLSVTMSWEKGLEAPIVRGMPYATGFYTGLTPVLKFAYNILSFDGSGTRYEVKLDNEQRWIIYASSNIR